MIDQSASSASTFVLCTQSLDPNLSADERQDQMLQCIASSLDDAKAGINTFYLIYAASLVFYMQAGFAMLCAGSVRMKNLQNTMLKNLLDACGASLGFYTVGYAFAWGGSSNNSGTTFIGTENFFLMDVDQKAFWLFQFAFAATSATIVAGTLAERCQMLAYLSYSTALTAFVYPVVAHAVWNNTGFLSSFRPDPLLGVGVVDFAGCLVVHTTGGLTALIAAFVLGPRKGRFHYDGDGKRCANDFPGHSVALKVLGVLILWFGWYGFNTGSVYYITSENQSDLAQNAAVNTTLAAASGTISALLAKAWLVERETGEAVFCLAHALMGCLSGLVSITGSCAYVESWAAIIIGFVSGLLYLAGSRLMIRIGIDDAVDAIPIHMIGGIWGSIAVGLFTVPKYLDASHAQAGSAGLFYSDGKLLACQFIGILFVVGWVSVLMFPFFAILHYLGWLRADSLEEIVGLDVSYHGGIHQGDTDNESSHQDEERQYYERRELERRKKQNRVRRRLLMMDLSVSGRSAVGDAGNNDGSRRLSGNGGLAGENRAENNGADSNRRSSGSGTAQDEENRTNGSRQPSVIEVEENW
eukprot:CAMPEP_0172532018 /NCGR_PEP_ID=MMETSP1067-20121228/5219_1 /TAXON_ID=265564 ORGANISM="Thalassiosira punctigera, Strain Tpunct2005C2" /NCGR_SAMPLE_ID=MMETSP1067 /ASSEMBLY_ACC=CAM_ASM_000444 /LENGTH=582 /DNA_ID=CAMNT_0013316477 /DNA_START=196 /DNA_END=1941 /DNA_ORIENTATION=+